MNDDNTGKSPRGKGTVLGWIGTFVLLFTFFAIITGISSIPGLFRALFGGGSKPVITNTPKLTNRSGKVEATIKKTPIPTQEVVLPVLTIPKIENATFTIDPIVIDTLKGTIKRENQTIEYKFTAKQDGIHRFEFSNVRAEIYLKMKIFNSLGETLDYKNYMQNGSGISVSLKAGKSYTIHVIQQENLGSYFLNIGKSKETEDISQYTIINDSIQYVDQLNEYIYTAQQDGIHRFEFSNVRAEIYLKIKIFNSLGETLDYKNYMQNGSGISVSLEAGKSYTIQVIQQDNLGAYILNIGRSKKIEDISQYAVVNDSIQYVDQQNEYIYTAQQDGIHHFAFTNLLDEIYLEMEILNSLGETLDRKNYMQNGSEISVTLVAGDSYTVRIIQQDETGDYQLNITK